MFDEAKEDSRVCKYIERQKERMKTLKVAAASDDTSKSGSCI